jgi:hypothetical protein
MTIELRDPTARRRLRSAGVASLGALFCAIGALGCGEEVVSEARISADNVEELGIAATEAVVRASQLQGANFLAPSSPPVAGGALAALAPPLASSIGDDGLPDVCESGRISASAGGDSIEFEACRVGDCEIDGRVSVTVGHGGDRITIRLDDLRARCDGAPAAAFRGDRIVCDGVESAAFACRFELAAFTGHISGERLRVRDLVVEHGDFGGVMYSGRVIDPAHGAFRFFPLFVRSGLEFDDCVGGVPASGVLEISAAGENQASIGFDGCTGYSICFLDAQTRRATCDDYTWWDWFGWPATEGGITIVGGDPP